MRQSQYQVSKSPSNISILNLHIINSKSWLVIDMETFWEPWQTGHKPGLVWNCTKIFNKAQPTEQNCTPSSYPLAPGYIPLLSPDELASCSLAMCPITFPQPLPTSQKVKRPLSYYSFIVQVQLVKNYPYNLNSLGRPPLGNLFDPPWHFEN